ncbi:hypothetical protein FVEG_16091 [Fusarium verticillioides 7600]|uniref:Uncharacterized protein n=1 Tax=Gibberella moniliformis (strain M3125 / FGSC 7600) TaxID=334819 RepID=W7MI28_GIBM7|nr:hypothetical protein FVEG_16091 [Fusarium verticillioides 7600]EWG47239.1 hypothetical protein FVEG_16091 [Fusarium verticillioides 7600]
MYCTYGNKMIDRSWHQLSSHATIGFVRHCYLPKSHIPHAWAQLQSQAKQASTLSSICSGLGPLLPGRGCVQKSENCCQWSRKFRQATILSREQSPPLEFGELKPRSERRNKLKIVYSFSGQSRLCTVTFP